MKKNHFKSPDLPPRPQSRPSLDAVAKRAYELWERDGCYHGRDREHWYAAEQELLKGATTTVDNPKSQPVTPQQQPIEPVRETVDLRDQEREARRSA